MLDDVAGWGFATWAWRSCWLQSCGASAQAERPRRDTSSHGLRTISVLLPDENRQLLRICVMKPQKSSFDVLGQMGALRRYARSLTRDVNDAEDLVHDALVRAYERRASFRPSGNIRSWLLSIVHNTFIDGVRSRRSEAARNAESERHGSLAMAAPQEHSVRLSQVREAFLDLAGRAAGGDSPWSRSKASPTRKRPTRSVFRSAR